MDDDPGGKEQYGQWIIHNLPHWQGLICPLRPVCSLWNKHDKVDKSLQPKHLFLCWRPMGSLTWKKILELREIISTFDNSSLMQKKDTFKTTFKIKNTCKIRSTANVVRLCRQCFTGLQLLETNWWLKFDSLLWENVLKFICNLTEFWVLQPSFQQVNWF